MFLKQNCPKRMDISIALKKKLYLELNIFHCDLNIIECNVSIILVVISHNKYKLQILSIIV